MSVRELLTRYRSQGRKALISYITVGDPNLEATELYVKSLVQSGTDIIELGVPFSDPMADGPVIQRASERALKNRVGMKDVLSLIGRLRTSGITTPIVIFTYFNPILAMGVAQFAKKAGECGADAVLIVDLPPEEAARFRVGQGEGLREVLSQAGIETVFLASPTTSVERLRLIDDSSTGCVYYVSRTGITGVQSSLSETLESELRALKKVCSQPVIVGFGISTPDQARQIASLCDGAGCDGAGDGGADGLADGVVVGSALIKIIEENQSQSEAAAQLAAFGNSLAVAIRGAVKRELA